MNPKELVKSPDTKKWHQMLLIVNQNSQLVPYNCPRHFKKLSRVRWLSENIFIFILQYIGLNLSTLSSHFSLLWFATGTSCAYLFLRGYSVVPGIWLGTLLAYYMANAGFLLSFCFASVFTLQAILLLWFSHHYISPTLIFYKHRPFAKFILASATLTAMISLLLLGISFLLLPNAEVSFKLWMHLWLANLNAIMIFSCALVTFDAYFTDYFGLKPQRSTLILFAFLLTVIIAFIFSPTLLIASCFALFILLVTIYIGARFGWCGALFASFLSGILLCFGAILGAWEFSFSGKLTILLLLQLFLCVNTLIGLSVAIGYKPQER